MRLEYASIADTLAMRMSALNVLQRWFDAHARGDMNGARRLMAENAVVTFADGTSVQGFDAFMQWYQERRDREGPTFSYEVVDLLGGTEHAAAVIVLRRDDTIRRQLALYGIAGDRITSVQLFER